MLVKGVIHFIFSIDIGFDPIYCIHIKEMYTTMNTVTLSARLTKDEAQKIDDLASALSLDRGSLLKQLIRKGYKDLQIQRALDAYRRGKITLSRAAEIAELSLRDILLRLPEESIELSYNIRELQRDMENI